MHMAGYFRGKSLVLTKKTKINFYKITSYYAQNITRFCMPCAFCATGV
jgi:hypothetical protein